MISNPVIDKKKCIKCLLCVDDCTAKAINPQNYNINNRCIRCGHCIAICPENALSARGAKSEELCAPSKSLSDDLSRLVKLRRSVRHYEDNSVPRDLIERIIDDVIHSPTGTNSRRTGITILHSREKIQELNDIIMAHFDFLTKILINKMTYPLLRLILGRKKTKQVFSYKKQIPRYWKGENILTHDAPLLMIFHGDSKASTPEQDGLIWATTAMILAESHGIGTCFNGFLVLGINSCRKARKYLDLPPKRKVYETLTAGYSKYKYRRTVPRERENVRFV